MDKIKELLKQLGGSEELSKQIVETLEAYVANQKTLLEAEYKTRLGKARDVIVEETNRYKAELAKKVQIFFESRADRVEAQIAKQVAIRESAAEGKLTKIAALVEGVEVNADGKADLQAIKEQLVEMTKKVGVVTEERDQAAQKANRAHGIAQKALKRNRQLEAALAESKKTSEKPVVAEGIEKPKIDENKVETKPVVTEGTENKEKPITKQGEQAQTTTVVSEGTVAKPKEEKLETAPIPQAPVQTLKTWDPKTIAATME